MSTYVTRVIEVKLPDIQGEVWKEEKLQDVKVFLDHMVYKVNSDHDFPYRVWIPDEDSDSKTESKVGHWEKSKECTWNWHLVKYWSDYNYGYHDKDKEPEFHLSDGLPLKEINEFCDNGGSIRDKYLSRWYGDDYNVRERGLAPDMAKETRVVMHADEENYCWGYTYVLLSEWEAIYDKELEIFKNKIKDHFNRAEHKTINEKLDKIYSKLTGEPIPEKTQEQIDEEEYDNQYDTLDYLFEEDFWEIQTLRAEIIKVYHIVEQLYGYIPDDRIRINYYFS